MSTNLKDILPCVYAHKDLFYGPNHAQAFQDALAKLAKELTSTEQINEVIAIANGMEKETTKGTRLPADDKEFYDLKEARLHLDMCSISNILEDALQDGVGTSRALAEKLVEHHLDETIRALTSIKERMAN